MENSVPGSKTAEAAPPPVVAETTPEKLNEVKVEKVPSEIEKSKEDKEEPAAQSNGTTTTTKSSNSKSRSSNSPHARNRRTSSSVSAGRRFIRPRTSISAATTKYRQLLRRSSRSTKSSQKIEAQVLAEIEEIEKQKHELEAKLKSIHEPKLIKCTSCFYNQQYFHIGDVISVTGEDLNKYYAKIITFWTTNCCERSVSVRWLVPIVKMSHPIWKTVDGFVPPLFREGIPNDKLIPMENITFEKRLPPKAEVRDLEEPFLLIHNNQTINLNTPESTIGTV